MVTQSVGERGNEVTLYYKIITLEIYFKIDEKNTKNYKRKEERREIKYISRNSEFKQNKEHNIRRTR